MIRRFPLLSYFVLAYAFTWAIEIPVALGARGSIDFHLPMWIEALAAFGPFAAAIIVLRVTDGPDGVSRLLASLVRWRVPPLWLAMTVVPPFLVMIAALAMTGETGKLFSGQLCRDLMDAGKMLELIFISSLIRGVGEEPGWRGYALPMLREKHGPLVATLLLWPVWAVWHLPAFLARPEFAAGAAIGFTFGILAATAWTTLLYDKTRSVLMLVLWHTLVNITRGIAGSASGEAFMAYAQVTTLLGIAVIAYWLITRANDRYVRA
ncbi:MAG: CPBP family intramembrane metalloprotease [Gammaproteobacteria bacterium]|nr:CPBP family intramembrane metalloprotease [Gammaproteobacteria bacterium]NND54041.1 CPBP family intramembrane metalloprotease [Gammaproteobacteria bacterium]